jgi:hypothetical protein
MLYTYCYAEVWFWQISERYHDYRRNVNWIKRNGPYK